MGRVRFPYVAISVLLAALREAVRGSAMSRQAAGKTHVSAPESTSMDCWLVRSQIVIVFVLVRVVPAVTTPNGQRGRFPKPRADRKCPMVPGRVVRFALDSVPHCRCMP